MSTYRGTVTVWRDRIGCQVGITFEVTVDQQLGAGAHIESEPIAVVENRDAGSEIVADDCATACAYIQRVWPSWRRDEWDGEAYEELLDCARPPATVLDR